MILETLSLLAEINGSITLGLAGLGAGIGIGFGTQQISQNFLSGLMLFFNRPFAEGDWINVSTFEGTVERIGWYHTQIRTFDRRPLFIPNSLFATTPIENPGRMYNRRIKEEIGLRYEDIGQIAEVVREVKTMLRQHDRKLHDEELRQQMEVDLESVSDVEELMRIWEGLHRLETEMEA